MRQLKPPAGFYHYPRLATLISQLKSLLLRFLFRSSGSEYGSAATFFYQRAVAVARYKSGRVAIASPLFLASSGSVATFVVAGAHLYSYNNAF